MIQVPNLAQKGMNKWVEYPLFDKNGEFQEDLQLIESLLGTRKYQRVLIKLPKYGQYYIKRAE